MAKKMLIQAFTLFILITAISTDKKEKKKKAKKPIIEEEIPSLYSWARKNYIFISDRLTLNKNTDSSHNFYYFTSNTKIPNNTILLKVPYNIMISQSSLEKHFQEKRNKKFAYLWDKIIENKNQYISYFSTKQFLYMAIIIEDAINKKKGAFYQKYKPYLDMYEYMSMDIFPVFYDEDEIHYLSPSSFGFELRQAVESLKEEYYIINNDLQISTSMQDTFLKYRVLTLANSVSFNNTKLKDRNDFNETVVVPFIDCFRKAVVSVNISAEYAMKIDKDNNYYLEVRTTRDIPKNEEIILKWRRLPNNECLLYYGFIEIGNYLAPKFFVNTFNKLFKKEMGIDPDKEFTDIMSRGRFELNTEFFSPDVVGSYYNLSKLFDKYKNKPEGRYQMMADNLNYYLNIYNGQFTDGNINLYIRGNDKQRYIKYIMKIEKRLIQNKMNYVNSVIQDIKEGKAKPPEDL
jgi:hypothetical protein